MSSIWTSFIGPFVHPVEEEGIKVVWVGIGILASYKFPLLEHMKIWCNIQVIIYSLIQKKHLIGNMSAKTTFIEYHISESDNQEKKMKNVLIIVFIPFFN